MHKRISSSRSSIAILGFCAAIAAPRIAPAAEPAPVWIFLKDKGYTSVADQRRAIAQFQLTLSPDASARRDARGVGSALSIGGQDLPVAASYAASIASTGADIRVRSSWLNAISVQATPAELARIKKMPFVDHVQPVVRFSQPLMVPEPKSMLDAARTRDVGPSFGGGPEDFYGASSSQLTQINIPAVHALGYTGAGVKIGVLDTGFKRTHIAFNHATHPINVLAEYDFINNDGDTSDTANGQHTHGTYILGTIGAYHPNVLVGGAYDASFILAKTEDVTQEVPAEEDQWIAGLEFLENNGADLVTSSLGYIDWYSQSQLNGSTAVTTIAAAAAAARGLPITNAAGNEGHDSNPSTSSLIAPADADLLITVGAVDSGAVPAWFTSDGPTADGRIKPEVVARGVSTATVNANSDSGVNFVDGTSLSTPLVASAVALIVQAHPNWSVEQIRHALFNTASGGGTFDPLYIKGYGVINTLAAVQYSFDKFFIAPNGGSWDTASNWNGNTKPISVSDVFILPQSGMIVLGPSTSARVHSLAIDAQNGPNPAILQLQSNSTFIVDKSLMIGTRGAVTQLTGTFIINGTTTNNGELNVNAQTFARNIIGNGSTNVGGNGWLFADSIHQESINVLGNGRAVIVPNGTIAATSVINALSINGGASPTGTLDLTDNALVIDYEPGNSPLETIASQIGFAFHGGAWDRPGITSDDATSTSFALGYADRSAISSVPAIFGGFIDGSSILIHLTRYGDANLDGTVNANDFTRLASNFGLSDRFWWQGDFNYDGIVNANDFTRLASNFGLSATGLNGDVTPENWALLAAAVPEPASSLVLGASATALLLQGRRRSTGAQSERPRNLSVGTQNRECSTWNIIKFARFKNALSATRRSAPTAQSSAPADPSMPAAVRR